MIQESLLAAIKVTLALVFGLLFFSILYFKPHWGLMDDSYLVYEMMKQVSEVGLFKFTQNFTLADSTSWGMFRPFYPAMAYLIYLPGLNLGPHYTFLLNLILSMLVLVYHSYILSKILRINVWPILLVLASFFYQYDLFQYPSLQEKMVMLIGTVFIQLCYTQRHFKAWLQILLLFVAVVIGASTKASFLIFYSMGVWAFVSRNSHELIQRDRWRPWVVLGFLILFGILAILFLGKISAQGSYTKQYDLSKILPNILSKEGVLFAVPIIFGLVNLFYRWKKGAFRFEEALPLIGVCAFLALFLPWGIKAYLQSIIGPAYAALWVTIFLGIFSFVPRGVWIVPFIVLGLLISSYRSLSMFSRLGDLGSIVERLKSESYADLKSIWVPCLEGSDSFRRFVNENNPGRYEVRFWDPAIEPHNKVAFFDNSLCPLPGRADTIDGCEVEYLLKGSWSRSFRLVRFDCKK